MEWNDGLTTKERVEQWRRGREERKKYLNEQYPNSAIKGINIEDLKKIGYAIGIGSNHTKKEFIDKIIMMQEYDNPIIQKNNGDELLLNDNVKLMAYIRR
jgi:uncharacterized protein YjdB